MNNIFLTGASLVTAYIISAMLGPVVIPRLKNFGQNVRDDGPKSHLKKQGTPSMGGIMILIAFVISALVFGRFSSDAITIVVITLAYGLVGFTDDYIKVVKKRSLGLRAWQKIVFQLVVTACFYVYLINIKKIGTDIYIPFYNGTLDLGILYAPFLFFVMVGTVNAVNLTDGLDGLASGVTVLVMMFFTAVCFAVCKGLSPVTSGAIGALLGFLLFNSHPAKVFMGDTGSLALGGLVASVAVITKMPLMLVIAGIIYVCESVSVILQVGYFKLTHGKRIFRMAPLHHHFELGGMPGIKVVQLFWIFTAVACVCAALACQYIWV